MTRGADRPGAPSRELLGPLEELLGPCPLKGVRGSLSLNKSDINSGERGREVTGPWPFALWTRPWELGKEAPCGLVDGEKENPLFSLATVWLAWEMATSEEWLLCDICSPFHRAIGAAGLAARLAHVLVRAWAPASHRLFKLPQTRLGHP